MVVPALLKAHVMRFGPGAQPRQNAVPCHSGTQFQDAADQRSRLPPDAACRQELRQVRPVVPLAY